jgi:formate/nitrite transporter FocA (FNT family)
MKRTPLRTYLLLSFIASAFLGVIVYYGTRRTDEPFLESANLAIISAGVTFIVTIVVIATLELSSKDDSTPADKPRLK